MKPGLAKFVVLVAASVGLTTAVSAQIGPPPPPPPAESVETLAADYAAIVSGTVSAFDPNGSPYSTRNVTLEVHQVLKGDHTSDVHIRLRDETRRIENWKLRQDLLLVGIPSNPNKEPAVIDLSDPKMAVLDEALRLIRNQDEVTQAVKSAIGKLISPGRFLLVLPKDMIAGTTLELPGWRDSKPVVDLPIDSALESTAHRVLGSSDIQARCSAVDALANFKSNDNIRLLQRLLHDDQYAASGQPEYRGGIEQHNFLVREQAYNVLHQWGLNPAPIELTKNADVMSTMSEYYASQTPSDEILRRLADNKNLKKIGIFGGTITDAQAELLGRMTHLQSLMLTAMKVSDDQFQHFKNLKELTFLAVNAATLTDASLPIIAGFKKLKSVDLSRNPMTMQGIEELEKELPNAEISHYDIGFAPFPLPMIRQTQADCDRPVYTLQPRDRRLSAWSTVKIGSLSGTLQWSKSPTGRDYIGPFGQQEVTLRLKNLRPHRNVEVDIDLWVIGSWDGDGSLGAGPDLIGIYITGVGNAMHSSFFNNDDGPGAKSLPLQSFPDPYPVGRHVAYTGASEVRTLGFTEPWDGIQYHRDAVYKLHYTFAHSVPDFEITITGENVSQPGITDLTKDEHWGIGGLRVKTD